jgi:hypothetical protein
MWWVARRRCRTHTEEPKTRFESVDPAKAMPLVDDASAAAAEDDALLAEGDDACEERSDRTDASHQEDVATSLHEHQQSREQEDEDLDEDEDDAAETDLTDHDGDDEEEDEDEDAEGEDEEEEGVRMDAQMKEALARAEAMAAKMGVNAFSNMTESVMAMEEFLVLDAPLPSAQPGTEAERMQMEDPAASDAHHAQDEAEDEAEDAGEQEEDDDLVNVENGEENEDGRDNQEAEQPAAALAATTEGEASGVMSTFWAQCENKDECNLCNTPFSFLVRRVQSSPHLTSPQLGQVVVSSFLTSSFSSAPLPQVPRLSLWRVRISCLPASCAITSAGA